MPKKSKFEFCCPVCRHRQFKKLNGMGLYACRQCSVIFSDPKLAESFSRSIDEHSENVRRVMEDTLGRIEDEFSLATPKSPCCRSSTYFVADVGQVCGKCGRTIQTTV